MTHSQAPGKGSNLWDWVILDQKDASGDLSGFHTRGQMPCRIGLALALVSYPRNCTLPLVEEDSNELCDWSISYGVSDHNIQTRVSAFPFPASSNEFGCPGQHLLLAAICSSNGAIWYSPGVDGGLGGGCLAGLGEPRILLSKLFQPQAPKCHFARSILGLLILGLFVAEILPPWLKIHQEAAWCDIYEFLEVHKCWMLEISTEFVWW